MRLSRSPVLWRHPLLMAVAWGLATGLCVPPMPLGPLIPFAMAGALLSLSRLSGWAAARWGFTWGVAFHLATMLWIRNVMSVGPVVAIGGGLVLLMGYLSLFSAFWAWGWSRLRDHGLIWLWPCLFAGIEVLRGYGQMSLPWLHVGYDFGSWPVLLQGVSIVGVHGLGFLIALLAVGIVVSLERGRMLLRLMLVALVLVWVGFGAWRLRQPETGRTLRVAVVQPSIPQTRKWDETYFNTVISHTFVTMNKLRQPVDLMVLPETAIPDFWSLRLWEGMRMRRFGDSIHADLLVGALDFDRDSAAPKGAWVRNSAFHLSPGVQLQRYDKMRLVPFSERLPFDNIFPVLNYVDLGEGDFSSGHILPTYQTRGFSWAPTICYELAYADFARLAVHNGARAFVDITNDGWFGRSLGPMQHWNIERFRTVETGLPLIRSANTGVSGVVDSKGRILTQSRLLEDTLLVATVHEGNPTFASLHGGWIEGLLALLGTTTLLLAVFYRSKAVAV